MLTVISVTHDDIEMGEPCSNHSCPEVLAIRRKVNDDVSVEINGEEARFQRVDSRYSASVAYSKLPARAQMFVSAFDDDDLPDYLRLSKARTWKEEMTQPFVFLLDIPDKFLPRGD